jgi:hypothetical protein
MYVKVYAPNGEPFEVTRDRADRLILNEGWTQTAPTITEMPVETPKPRSRGRKLYSKSED